MVGWAFMVAGRGTPDDVGSSLNWHYCHSKDAFLPFVCDHSKKPTNQIPHPRATTASCDGAWVDAY